MAEISLKIAADDAEAQRALERMFRRIEDGGKQGASAFAKMGLGVKQLNDHLLSLTVGGGALVALERGISAIGAAWDTVAQKRDRALAHEKTESQARAAALMNLYGEDRANADRIVADIQRQSGASGKDVWETTGEAYSSGVGLTSAQLKSNILLALERSRQTGMSARELVKGLNVGSQFTGMTNARDIEGFMLQNFAAANVGNMGEFVSQYWPQIASLQSTGLSPERAGEIMDVMTYLLPKGESGAEASTAMSGIINAVLTKDVWKTPGRRKMRSAAEMPELAGLSADQKIERFRDQFSAMTEGEQLDMLTKIGGSRGPGRFAQLEFLRRGEQVRRIEAGVVSQVQAPGPESAQASLALTSAIMGDPMQGLIETDERAKQAAAMIGRADPRALEIAQAQAALKTVAASATGMSSLDETVMMMRYNAGVMAGGTPNMVAGNLLGEAASSLAEGRTAPILRPMVDSAEAARQAGPLANAAAMLNPALQPLAEAINKNTAAQERNTAAQERGIRATENTRTSPFMPGGVMQQQNLIPALTMY